MKTLLRLLLKSQPQRNDSGQAQTEKGMTLVELLVGAIMAFLIITPMLGFVVDMLNTDRREQVKSNTEQDIQAAVDFIAQDLSQAIYIYDNKGINGTAAPVGIKDQLPKPPNGTPILVFWKRQQLPKSLPIDTSLKPINCPPSGTAQCNDTYVLSLVAYYQFKETDPKSIWCQPSGGTCPTRIARYEIRDGVKNPSPPDPTNPYYKDTDTETKESQRKSKAFNPKFNFNNPTKEVTTGVVEADFPSSEVLVNYIDDSSANVPVPIEAQCQTLLGVTSPPATNLLITDRSDNSAHSFYACVDTSRNLARVTIRGNSLRRLQPNDAKYNASRSAFFPTATVQVQGLGARGK